MDQLPGHKIRTGRCDFRTALAVTKRCGNDKRFTRAEADTGPNDEVNIGLLLLIQGGLPGPNNEEVKIGNQVVSTGLIYVSRQ